MVIEYPSRSIWDKIKRTIAFFFCPEFRNYENKLDWMQEDAVWSHLRWARIVKGKEKGITRQQRKIKQLEKEIKLLKAKINPGPNENEPNRMLVEETV